MGKKRRWLQRPQFYSCSQASLHHLFVSLCFHLTAARVSHRAGGWVEDQLLQHLTQPCCPDTCCKSYFGIQDLTYLYRCKERLRMAGEQKAVWHLSLNQNKPPFHFRLVLEPRAFGWLWHPVTALCSRAVTKLCRTSKPQRFGEVYRAHDQVKSAKKYHPVCVT